MPLKLFGGDPRSVYHESLIRLNVWYDMIFLICNLLQLPMKSTESTWVIVFVVYALAEIIRIFFMVQYKKGSMPCFIAYIVMTILPMIVIDFIWFFFMDRNEFDSVAIIGQIVIHCVEFVTSFPSAIRISNYQSRFFTFRYAYRPLVNKEATEMEELSHEE